MRKNDVDSLLMKIFFSYAWKKRPVFCECGCGKKIPKEFSTAIMDHILEKNVYPECKYSVDNIMFVTPECHAQKTGGFPNEKQLEYIDWAHDNYDFIVEQSRNFEERILKKLEENELYSEE